MQSDASELYEGEKALQELNLWLSINHPHYSDPLHQTRFRFSTLFGDDSTTAYLRVIEARNSIILWVFKDPPPNWQMNLKGMKERVLPEDEGRESIEKLRGQLANFNLIVGNLPPLFTSPSKRHAETVHYEKAVHVFGRMADLIVRGNIEAIQTMNSLNNLETLNVVTAMNVPLDRFTRDIFVPLTRSGFTYNPMGIAPGTNGVSGIFTQLTPNK